MNEDRCDRRKTIGIITGSGPEAGVDMWIKILQANKRLLADRFRGDLDAPRVRIISEPDLGLSMEMDLNHHEVWRHLKKAAESLSPVVDVYAIACNTLNCYQDKLADLELGTTLISFADVVAEYVRRKKIARICLLGARPVMSLGKWSAYRQLPPAVEVEVFHDPDILHRLIYDIKIHGPRHTGIVGRFEEVLSRVHSDIAVLACTELPLIKGIETEKKLLDVTELVAEKLVEATFPDQKHSVEA